VNHVKEGGYTRARIVLPSTTWGIMVLALFRIFSKSTLLSSTICGEANTSSSPMRSFSNEPLALAQTRPLAATTDPFCRENGGETAWGGARRGSRRPVGRWWTPAMWGRTRTAALGAIRAPATARVGGFWFQSFRADDATQRKRRFRFQ
jgi:hypothetical protein